MTNTRSIKKAVLLFLFSIAIFAGCGGGNTLKSSDISIPTKSQTRTLSTTLTKGNYVEVAKFVYANTIVQDKQSAKMDVLLPGGIERGIPTKNIYTIDTVYSADKVRKIVVKNHKERLEIKFLDRDMVKIILRMPGDTKKTKMAFYEFATQQ